MGKIEPQTIGGIFMGYELGFGCRWRRLFRVATYGAVDELCLHPESRTIARKVPTQLVERVMLEPSSRPYTFPWQEPFMKARYTPAGLRDAKDKLHEERMYELGPADVDFGTKVSDPEIGRAHV